jgi:hypothetical protein
VIWDIEHMRTSTASAADRAIHSFALGEGVSSISWLPREENIIALGTNRGWVRLYDLRMKKSMDLTFSLSDGEKFCKVKGIRPDPWQSSTIAVFSDIAGDFVRILDLRVGDSTGQKSRFNVLVNIQPPSTDANDRVGSIVDVAWSPLRANTLAVASTSLNYIPIYSVTRASSEMIIRSPLHSCSLPEPSKSISWSHPRMLIALQSGILDVNIRERQALVYSPTASLHDKLSSHGFLNPSLLNRYTSNDSGPSSGPATAAAHLSDIDISDENKNIAVIIRKRAMAGYSVNAGKNIQVISDELDYLYRDISNETTEAGGINISKEDRIERRQYTIELYKLWEWVDRMVRPNDEDIADCGIMHELKQVLPSISNDTPCRHAKLGVFVYVSESRTKCLELCGWLTVIGVKRGHKKNDKFASKEQETKLQLDDLISSVSDDSFERAAALALWHGDVALAVETLRSFIANRSITTDQEVLETHSEAASDDRDSHGHGWDEPITTEYMHVVSLAAMCFAGYRHSIQKDDIWVSMCEQVISLLESHSRIAKAYLISACKFLLVSLDSNPDYSWLLKNDEIYLEDRVAFACDFVVFDSMTSWVRDVFTSCQTLGRLDGLLLTGLSQDGLAILQAYLDRTSDIQTCALLASQLVSSVSYLDTSHGSALSDSLECEKLWLYEYRNLLNKWQMFFARASLDVEVGKIQRRRDLLSNDASANMPGSDNKSSRPPGQSSMHMSSNALSTDRSKVTKRQQFAQPVHRNQPHLLIRCHYCSSSLPIDLATSQQQQIANSAFTRKQRPVLNCCVSCKRQLPRCYVCQLYLGMVNPNLQLNRMAAQRRLISDARPGAPSAIELDKLEEHVLEYGQWFFFCQRCKHGGHATCIDEWFASTSSTIALQMTDSDLEGNKSNEKIVLDRTLLPQPQQQQQHSVCGVNGCSCQCTLYR